MRLTDYDADDITPAAILAVLRGESPRDDIGRDYEALDDAMDLASVLEEIASEPAALRELIEALAAHQGRFPAAQAILAQHVDRAVAESGAWLDCAIRDARLEREADRAERLAILEH